MANLISAKIAGSTVDRVVRFEQTKAYGLHTVGTIDIAYSAVRPWLAQEWAPIEIYLQGTTWYGYVHHGGVATDVRDVSGSVLRYTFIGTSLPMNTERTRSWRGVSASGVVRQIGREHRLRTVITRHKTIMPYYAQAGVSDWKVLQEMAEKTGHRLWVDGATLSFVDPKLLLEGVRAIDIPAFSQNKAIGIPDNLYAFTSKAGAMVPRSFGPTARQVIHGMDVRTARPLKAATTPSGPASVITKVATGTRVGTSGQAADSVGARASVSSGWITATALVVGSPQVVPGMLVTIGGSKIPSEQSGRWLVTGVNHRVLLDASKTVDPFTSTLTLERDQFYGPDFRSATRVSNTRDTVPARMRDGFLWEAEYMESINVG